MYDVRSLPAVDCGVTEMFFENSAIRYKDARPGVFAWIPMKAREFSRDYYLSLV